jgi:hypothetical protein
MNFRMAVRRLEDTLAPLLRRTEPRIMGDTDV